MDKSEYFDSCIEEFLRQLEFEKKKWQPNAVKLFDRLVEKLKSQNRDSAELKTEIHFKTKGVEHFTDFKHFGYYRARGSKIRSLQTIYSTFFEDIPFEFEDEIWPQRMLFRVLSSMYFFGDDFYVAFSPIAARALLKGERA